MIFCIYLDESSHGPLKRFSEEELSDLSFIYFVWIITAEMRFILRVAAYGVWRHLVHEAMEGGCSPKWKPKFKCHELVSFFFLKGVHTGSVQR